jgi:hypothetical protein
MKGCSTQQTCLCSIDIKKVTTQQATTQCDLLSAMEKKLFFMQKKKQKKKRFNGKKTNTYLHFATCNDYCDGHDDDPIAGKKRLQHCFTTIMTSNVLL